MRRTGSDRARLAALAFAAVSAASAARAVPSIEAEISPSEIGTGEQAVYTLVVTDAAGGEITFPRFGELIVHGPSQNNQSIFTFSNGVQTIRASRIYSWTVQAARDGTYTIGPATLRHNGDTYVSNGVELKVSGSAAPRAQQQRRRNPFGGGFPSDPWDDFDPFANFPVDPWGRRGEADVFLRAVVDKGSVFLGEQVTLSLYLYSQVDVAGVSTVSFPKLDGFWAEDIEAPTQLVPEQKLVKGVPYRAYLLRRRALFPLRAGKLVVDPVEAQVNLGLPIFRGAAAESVKRKSSALDVEVKALPADGQPPAFEAAHVGRFSVTAQLAPQSVRLGQPAQLKVVVQGSGNLRSVRVPKPALPPGLKTYDPTIKDDVKISGVRYGGTKSVEWVVVPERTGVFEIPGLELSYFDPAKGAYDVARTAAQVLAVTAPDAAAAPPVAGTPITAPTASNILTSGVRPIRLTADLSARALPPVWKRGYFWPLATGPVALWVLVASAGLVVGLLRRRDPERLKVKRAKGAAAKRLKAAREALGQRDADAFLAEVIRALQQFVTDKTGIGAQGLTREELGRALVERGYANEDVASLVKLLDTCETARFMPGARSKSALERVLADCQSVLDALDGARPRRAP